MTAATLAATAALAGCGGSSDRTPDPAVVSPSATAVSAQPTDKPGGTLQLVTDTMPTGDPGWAVTTADRAFARLVTRTLYAYPADQDVEDATIARPDLATGAPKRSQDELTYTVQLRNVRWDLSRSPRQIIAADVARGIKRLCSPPNPSPLRAYFAATLVGFNDYCTALATKPVEEAKDFIENAPSPEGIEVINNTTIAFHLIKPVSDFVDVLALPATAPVPYEALDYLPNSPEYLAHLVSNGPYRITEVTAGKYKLGVNQQWPRGADGIRRGLPDHIEITTGVDAATAQARIEAGEADMSLDSSVPIERAAELHNAGDERLSVSTVGSTMTLAVARHGPAATALDDPAVRQTLAICVNRIAVVEALGGPPFATAATQLLQPTMIGYSPLDLFPTANGAGDAAKCGEGLAKAPGGPVSHLTLLISDSARDSAVAAALATTFAQVGVRLDIQTRSGADFAAAAVSPQAQTWDLALTTLTPQWYGRDAGRAVFQPLLDPNWVGPRPVDGGYDSEDVLAAMGVALRATTEAYQTVAWADVEKTVLRDVVVIPLAVVTEPKFHSEAVLSFTQVPSIGTGDPANVALGPA